MNETRKQIIELISDYMDKTLSEGCLLNGYSNEINIGEYYTYGSYADGYFETNINGYELRFQRLKDNGNWDIGYYQIEKIIGHYDITAVLKYMFDMIVEMTIDIEFIAFYYSGYLGKIPHKPLHLYSEQEEKDLLELLLKLK